MGSKQKSRKKSQNKNDKKNLEYWNYSLYPEWFPFSGRQIKKTVKEEFNGSRKNMPGFCIPKGLNEEIVKGTSTEDPVQVDSINLNLLWQDLRKAFIEPVKHKIYEFGFKLLTKPFFSLYFIIFIFVYTHEFINIFDTNTITGAILSSIFYILKNKAEH